MSQSGDSALPVDDVLALQVVEGQSHLTQVEFDCVLVELDVLLQVVAQVSSQQQVHHHEHVFLILERVPGDRGPRAQFPKHTYGAYVGSDTHARTHTHTHTSIYFRRDGRGLCTTYSEYVHEYKYSYWCVQLLAGLYAQIKHSGRLLHIDHHLNELPFVGVNTESDCQIKARIERH